MENYNYDQDDCELVQIEASQCRHYPLIMTCNEVKVEDLSSTSLPDLEAYYLTRWIGMDLQETSDAKRHILHVYAEQEANTYTFMLMQGSIIFLQGYQCCDYVLAFTNPRIPPQRRTIEDPIPEAVNPYMLQAALKACGPHNAFLILLFFGAKYMFVHFDGTKIFQMFPPINCGGARTSVSSQDESQ